LQDISAASIEPPQISHIQILYRLTISERMDKLSVKQPYLFQYGEIKDQLSTIMRKWFDLKKRIGFAYELFFGEMYNSELYLSNKFLIEDIPEEYRSDTKIMEKSSISRKQHEETINRIIPYIENLELLNRLSSFRLQ
jgi:hypothetical protein